MGNKAKYVGLKESIATLIESGADNASIVHVIEKQYTGISRRHISRMILEIKNPEVKRSVKQKPKKEHVQERQQQPTVKEQHIHAPKQTELPRQIIEQDIPSSKQTELPRQIIEQDLYATESTIYKNGRLLTKTSKVINQYTFDTSVIETESIIAAVLGKILSILKTEHYIKVTKASKSNVNIYKVIEDNCKFISIQKDKQHTVIRFCSEAFNPASEIDETSNELSNLISFFENELSKTHRIRRNWIDNLMPKLHKSIHGEH